MAAATVTCLPKADLAYVYTKLLVLAADVYELHVDKGQQICQVGAEVEGGKMPLVVLDLWAESQ